MTKVTDGTDRPNSTWRYYQWPHHGVIRDRLLCVEQPLQRNERLAVGLFIAGAVIVVVLVVVVVASH